jgi:hypothetical protein
MLPLMNLYDLSRQIFEQRQVTDCQRSKRMPDALSGIVDRTKDEILRYSLVFRLHSWKASLSSTCVFHSPRSILRNMIREDKAALVTDTFIFLSSPTPPLFLLRPGFMLIRLYLSVQHSHQMYAIYLPVSLPVFIRAFIKD